MITRHTVYRNATWALDGGITGAPFDMGASILRSEAFRLQGWTAVVDGKSQATGRAVVSASLVAILPDGIAWAFRPVYGGE